MTLKEQTFSILDSAINAVKPAVLFPAKIKRNGSKVIIGKNTFDLDKYKKIYTIGAGKASAGMALKLEKILPDKITSGLVITNYGNYAKCNKTEIIEAAHPITDKNGIEASQKIKSLAQSFSGNDLVFVLISGGASALMEIPQEGISPDDLKTVNTLLLTSGADIGEINTIRKHLSKIKGGLLQKMIYPAESVTLIISDVISDQPHIIASGPTCADPTTFADAWNILEKYQLAEKLPSGVTNYLRSGLDGIASETPKPGNIIFKNSQSIILGTNQTAQKKAQATCREFGFKTIRIENLIEGESRKQATEMVSYILQQDLQKPTAIIWGGETTVTLQGNGKGGRNQEFVLAALQKFKDRLKQPYIFLSCGTDGRDGPTDAAGAWINEKSWQKSLQKNLLLSDYLNNNDSYTFFNQIKLLIKTGSTGTNVMDIGIFVTSGA